MTFVSIGSIIFISMGVTKDTEKIYLKSWAPSVRKTSKIHVNIETACCFCNTANIKNLNIVST